MLDAHQIADEPTEIEGLSGLGRRIATPFVVTVVLMCMLLGSILSGVVTYRHLRANEQQRMMALLDSHNSSLGMFLTQMESSLRSIGFSLTQEPALSRLDFWKVLRQPLRDLPHLRKVIFLTRLRAAEQDNLIQEVRGERVIPMLPGLRKQLSKFSIHIYSDQRWQQADTSTNNATDLLSSLEAESDSCLALKHVLLAGESNKFKY